MTSITSSGIVTHFIWALIIYENMPEWHPSQPFPCISLPWPFQGDGPLAALREVERRVRASTLSVLKRDPHTPASGPAAEKPRPLVRGASLKNKCPDYICTWDVSIPDTTHTLIPQQDGAGHISKP